MPIYFIFWYRVKVCCIMLPPFMSLYMYMYNYIVLPVCSDMDYKFGLNYLWVVYPGLIWYLAWSFIMVSYIMFHFFIPVVCELPVCCSLNLPSKFSSKCRGMIWWLVIIRVELYFFSFFQHPVIGDKNIKQDICVPWTCFLL